MNIPKIAAMALLLSGCAYDVKPVATPAFDAVTSSSAKIGGRWLLYVDASQFNTTMKPRDLNCAAHSFPVDANAPFSESIRRSLANVFEAIETVEAAPASWSARPVRGLIVVRAENIDGRFQVMPGFWGNKASSEVDASASIQIDGKTGRLFGQTLDARGRDETAVGFLCDGVSKSLTGALERTIRDLSRKIVEAASNSDKVRAAR